MSDYRHRTKTGYTYYGSGNIRPTNVYGPTYYLPSYGMATLSVMDDDVSSSRRCKTCSHSKSIPAYFDSSSNLTYLWDSQVYGDNKYYPGWPISATVQTELVHYSPGYVPELGTNPAAPNPLPWNELVASLGDSVELHMQSKTNVLENLATLGQTIRMVKQPLVGLRALARKEKWRYKTTAELSKLVSGGWLQYRYGWNPLRYSFQAFSEVWQKSQDHRRFLMKSLGTNVSLAARRVYTHSYPPSPKREEWSAGTFRTQYPQIAEELISRETRICVSCDRFLSEKMKIASQMQTAMDYLHANSLFDVLWELLPFSFCVDWLINVDMLTAAGLSTRLQMPDISNLCYSIKEKLVWRHLMTTGYGNLVSYYNRRTNDGVGVVAESSVGIRSTYQRNLGFPSGTDIVGFFGGVNLIHSADATALFIQMLR